MRGRVGLGTDRPMCAVGTRGTMVGLSLSTALLFHLLFFYILDTLMWCCSIKVLGSFLCGGRSRLKCIRRNFDI